MSNKHDANVRKSTLVNFQIGLIASLLFTYVMFEVYTAKPVLYSDDNGYVVEEPPLEWKGDYKIYEEPKPKQLAVKLFKPIVDPQKFKIVDTDVVEGLKNEFKNTESVKSAPFDPNAIDNIKKEDPPVLFDFKAVEDVPIFPGCEKLSTNKEKASCFSEKIRRIVSKKFNTGLGEEYGLKGIQRIYTQFDVDEDGLIKNIQIRAAHPRLKKEAERVINLFPQMTPGKQRPVTVKYQLPIVFKIQN